MNKELFEEIILKLQLAQEKHHQLYKLGIDLMEFTEPYERIIDVLFQSHFNKDQLQWIDWYLYERTSFTKNGEPNQAWKTVNGEQIEICHHIDSLWETVQEYEYDAQKDWDERWPGRRKP
jgi:hypothetical protein